MIWTILCLNLLTILAAFKKRMILYGLFCAIFLFLVTGQAFQIQSDLSSQHSVYYLHNLISVAGFSAALWYVLGISVVTMIPTLFLQGYRAHSQAISTLVFRPPRSFYWVLIALLTVLSLVLVFAVVGWHEFLHSSRPGYHTGSTIFIVLLFLGVIPLLFKILYRCKLAAGDIACFVVSFAVTAAFSRIHLILYLTAILLAFFYASGWSDRPISFTVVLRVLLFGGAAFVLFFGIGALHDAQNFVSGSFGDLVSYIVAHPDKSILSVEYNYRVGVEGMSGIAGAFSQFRSHPELTHFDGGASWLIQGSVQWLPGVIKNRAGALTHLSEQLNWYKGSIVATGAESYFESFGWLGVVLYPLSMFVLGWYLPLRVLATETAPPLRLAVYTLFATCIFFVRGSLPVWMAFSFSYSVVIAASWILFRPYFADTASLPPALKPNSRLDRTGLAQQMICFRSGLALTYQGRPATSRTSSTWKRWRWMVLVSVAAASVQLASAQVSVMSFGAKCDWNGTNGTDDTAAFNRAAEAANKAYVATEAPASVLLAPGQSCLIAGTVTLGSGVVVEGPGALVVPGVQSGPVLQFLNADQSGVENAAIDILNTTKLNNPYLAAILWIDTKSDRGAHRHFFARNNAIQNGSYGISVFSSIGTGSLEDVDISGNTVTSSTVYTNSDGIHVGGNVHAIGIRGNRVSNRGDAALGLTSGPGPERTLSGAVVSDNICLNDLVGLDNSGGTNAIWSNNYVSATAPTSKSSNPAARSMTFVGITPVNVKFVGNYLQNYQGADTDVAAKTDDAGSNEITRVEWAGNTIVGPAAMWLAANTAAVHDNYFSPGATILVEYDGINNYPGQNIDIGPNYWMGSGTISAPGNPGLYFNNSVATQHANGTITVVGKRNFRKQ